MLLVFIYDIVPKLLAGVAQLVEQLICNQQVRGSNPFASSGFAGRCQSGQMERTVNPPAIAYGGSNPPLPTVLELFGGNSSGGRASAFQAEGRGFESRFPLQYDNLNFEDDMKWLSSPCSSGVEHFLGKEEVTGSIPVMGSSKDFCEINQGGTDGKREV